MTEFEYRQETITDFDQTDTVIAQREKEGWVYTHLNYYPPAITNPETWELWFKREKTSAPRTLIME